MTEPVIVDWKVKGDQLEVMAISVKEIVNLVGPEVRVIGPFVMLALQTGQLFPVPENVGLIKETAQRLIKLIMSKVNQITVEPMIQKDEKDQLLGQAGAMSNKMMLGMLVEMGGGGHREGTVAEELGNVGRAIGERYDSFLRAPTDPQFSEVLERLSKEQKRAISIVTRVSMLK